MRTFIAVEFNDELKNHMDGLAKYISKYSKTGNFTRRDNYHLTLRFIGETPTSDIELLCEAIQETAVRNEGFELFLSELGEFKRESKSVVWAGIKDDKRELSRLASSLEKSLELQGFPRDKKKFSPHITLGREVSLIRDLKYFEDYIKTPIIIPFKKISLMESVRIGPNLVYKRVFCSDLKK
ncbi:MAG: RNA 2',3'-cyclic phosphodiesterase [Lachnospiraceae bacterium]|nr:RNA 2',3'-cyclic phosphodiesterase [Lachnospiraceae bacterium]